MQIMKIFRCDTSPYQSPDFSQREKEVLESLPGVSYLEKNENPTSLITNTLTDIENLNAEGVELIIHPNSGYDNFPLSFVKNASFPIIIGSEIRAFAVSEYILYCLFERFSRVPFQKTWDRSWPKRCLLKDQQVLLIGLGKIGKKIKSSLTPLVDKIWAVDPFEEAFKSTSDVPLNKCSVVILCSGLNETSHKMINSDLLNCLPPNVTIINAARGKLIDQKSLINFLKDNPESYAYLDVFEKEPVSLETLDLPNLSLTSHIAGVFDAIDESIIDFEKKVLEDFINDRSNFEKKYQDSILKNRIHDNILI